MRTGGVGTQSLDQWEGNVEWVFANLEVPGPNGKRLTATPDIKAWFTNDYLAE